MKVAIVSSQGGHLGQMQILFTKEVLGNNPTILVTEKPGARGERKQNYFQKMYDAYFFNKDSLGFNPFAYLLRTWQLFRLYRKEKVNLVVTNGAQLSIPAVLAGKISGAKTMFIDTVIRVKTPNWSAKFCYYFTDIFLVQHESMKDKYGPKAKFWGGIL